MLRNETQPPLRGKTNLTEQSEATVLVVEDEALIAMDIQSIMENAGYRVVGPVSNVQAALAIVAREKPHIALLDINLGRSNVFELADALARSDIPMLFVTGHSRATLTGAHKDRPMVAKPFLPDVLLAAMKDLRKKLADSA